MNSYEKHYIKNNLIFIKTQSIFSESKYYNSLSFKERDSYV